MKAESIMTRHPVVVAGYEPIRRAAQLMAQVDVGALPVVDNYDRGRLIGIITDRDIVVRHDAAGASPDCCVHDHMTRAVGVVHGDSDVRDVLGRMAHDQVRRIPVVDEHHTVLGMITQADIVRRLGRKRSNAVKQVVARISEPAKVVSTVGKGDMR